MNIQVVGLQKESLLEVMRTQYSQLTVVEKDPDMIICYGGDGTLLWGEREYPGIPKVMIRNSRIHKNEMIARRDAILQLLSENQYRIVEHMKLHAQVQDEQRLALNDIVIGNPHVNGAVRFTCTINGRSYSKEVFADGIVVATPIGSTGYFQSITDTNFEMGIGIAFNNAIHHIHHLVLHQNATVVIDITRGPARLASDNDENEIALTTGDTITIRAADVTAKAIEFPKEHAHLNLNIGMNRTPLAFH